METVNNIASAATKAIWGDGTNTNETNTSEPVSGQTGNVEKGEPYDAGNKDSTTTDSTTGGSSGNATGNTAATGPIRPEHETDKTGVTSVHQPSSATASDKPTSSNAQSTGPEPSVSADPGSAPQNTQKQQGADRPHEEPDSEEHNKIQETKKEAEEAAKVNTDGPGPRPLEETHKGGASGGGAPTGGDEDEGPQKESHGEGTGEKYVKSSGMKADGGDFDAANPGAGKEADRLLETKGIHHEAGSTGPPADDPEAGKSSGKDKKDKVSFGDKIKAKLHKH